MARDVSKSTPNTAQAAPARLAPAASTLAPGQAPARRAASVALCVGLATAACPTSDPEPVRVETRFELFAPEVVESSLWRCATALPPVTREADTLNAVLGPDGDGVQLDRGDAATAMQAVGDELRVRGVGSRPSTGGVAAARAAIDAGVPALVPFAIPSGARPVIVGGYRTVEAEDGTCTDTLQDLLVVDTVEVMAYGLPVPDYLDRLAGDEVLALDTDPEATRGLAPELFGPAAP